ncbi:hypothetical protein TNCV_3641751 [Trichonephila clavipes]|nr:hypothetical protein TNCV_3641751 [Trichonephila clavipes]
MVLMLHHTPIRLSGRVVAYRTSPSQIDHLIGTPARAPQHPMITYNRKVTVRPGPSWAIVQLSLRRIQIPCCTPIAASNFDSQREDTGL